MIKLSQYIMGKLADWGVRDVFLVTGGGAMHLNDALAREPGFITCVTTTNKPRPWRLRAMRESPATPAS